MLFCKLKLFDGEIAIFLFSGGTEGGGVVVDGLFLLVGSSKSIFKTEDVPKVLGSGGWYFGF